MKRALGILALGTIAMLAVGALSGAEPPKKPAAQDKAEAKGRCRVFYFSAGSEVRSIDGQVTQMPDGSYEVKTDTGAVVTLRKNQVKAIKPLDEETKRAAPASPGESRGSESILRRPISDAEIEELLKDIVAKVDESVVGVKLEDLEAPLPLNVDSIKEMFREAGLTWKEGVPPEKQENLLLKPHFAMVYTSPAKAAQRLGARLESVWTWNVKFMRMLKVPARRPEHKLEIYYFGTFAEYQAYSTRTSGRDVMFTLGYYVPKINRSHFYEMETWPPVAHRLEAAKTMPPDEGAKKKNEVERWVEFQNMDVIQHETGHHIHFNIGLFPRNGLERESSVPIWLVEGTTMMFEIPPSSAGGSLGILNHNRLNEVRKFWGPHPLSTAQWKLFLIDNGVWASGVGRGDVALSYPLGWSMVYYLWKEHRDGYAKYLRTVFGREEDFRMTNTEREKEFEDIFGIVNDDWIKKFYKFLDSLVLKPSLLPPEIH
jgi:hypothetical protein